MNTAKSFASDNNSGIHPHILHAINQANTGHVKGYGDDPLTLRAIAAFQELFGEQCAVHFALTGTGANIVGLQTAIQSYHSILCAHTAHIHVDECGAPEKFTGAKLIAINTPDGKLTPALVQPHLTGFGFEHHSQPGIISITQATEMGTVYTAQEIKALADLAQANDMLLHVDGARIANALASLNLTVKEMLVDTGVDLLSFGGTKNGMMFGEAIVLLNPSLKTGVRYYRKQAAQLYSKMRYVAAQYLAYFNDDLWLNNARHSNQMATLLYNEVKTIPEISVTQAVQSNGVFAKVPPALIEPLRNQYFFYDWNAQNHEVRWMTSFDTTREDVLNFVACIKELLGSRNK